MSDSPLPLPEDKWKLTANATYQEVMKTLMTLVTASLVLPIWFVSNFVPELDKRPVREYLQCRPWAYRSWAFLSYSLLFGILFYLASSKFVKAVCGGYTENKKVLGFDPEFLWEKVRDDSGVLMAVFFIVGLVAAFLFFQQP